MAFDFDSALPILNDKGGVHAECLPDGSVVMTLWSEAPCLPCLTLSKKDATILAKFLSDVYLESPYRMKGPPSVVVKSGHDFSKLVNKRSEQDTMAPTERTISTPLIPRAQPARCQVIPDDGQRCEMSATVWVAQEGNKFKICEACHLAWQEGFFIEEDTIVASQL